MKAAQKSSGKKTLWQFPLGKYQERGFPWTSLHLAGPVHALQELNAASALRAAICLWPCLRWQKAPARRWCSSGDRAAATHPTSGHRSYPGQSPPGQPRHVACQG